MNIKISITLVAVAALVQLSFLPATYQHSNFIDDSKQAITENVFAQRMEHSTHVLDFANDGLAKHYIEKYLNRRKRDAEIILGRAPMYLPMIDKYLQKYNLPEDLKYIPIIESALSPKARSSKGATGLWQFMRYTAKEYGLTVDSQMDERRDPHKSTEAALKYLADLYDIYGNWSLAISTYNCGTVRMNKAIRLADSHEYAKVRKYLPKETRRYLSKIMAANYILNNYQFHGLQPDYPSLELLDTQNFTLYREFSFKQISELTGVSTKVLWKLNPVYHNGLITANKNGNQLVLPRLPIAAVKELLP